MSDDPRPIHERDAEICRRYGTGKVSLDALGMQWGISRERVRQIVRKGGVEHHGHHGPIPFVGDITPEKSEAWSAFIQGLRQSFRGGSLIRDLADKHGKGTQCIRSWILGRDRWTKDIPNALTWEEFQVLIRKSRVEGLHRRFPPNLSNDDARTIREKVHSKEWSQAMASRLYNISQPNVTLLVQGKIYADAGGPISEARHKTRTLGPEKAVQMRVDYAKGDISVEALAKRDGVSRGTAHNAIHKKIYPDAGGPDYVPRRRKTGKVLEGGASDGNPTEV